MKQKYIRGSTATKRYADGTCTTDLKALAKAYLSWGDIPKHIGDLRAFEISLLAQDYLRLLEKTNDKIQNRPMDVYPSTQGSDLRNR